MRLILTVILLMPFWLAAQERYYLLSGDATNESQLRKAITSQRYIEVDMETGELIGRYDSNKFKAVYDVKSTSSGFVKGFYYGLILGYLQRDVVNSEDFNGLTASLSRANRFYFYPDILVSPQWHFLEVSVPDLPKLVFVRKN